MEILTIFYLRCLISEPDASEENNSISYLKKVRNFNNLMNSIYKYTSSFLGISFHILRLPSECLCRRLSWRNNNQKIICMRNLVLNSYGECFGRFHFIL
jgi:hypothetical protein